MNEFKCMCYFLAIFFYFSTIRVFHFEVCVCAGEGAFYLWLDLDALPCVPTRARAEGLDPKVP